MDPGRLRGFWNIDLCIYSKWDGDQLNVFDMHFLSKFDLILQSLPKNMHLSLNGDRKPGLTQPEFTPAHTCSPFWTFGGMRDNKNIK